MRKYILHYLCFILALALILGSTFVSAEGLAPYYTDSFSDLVDLGIVTGDPDGNMRLEDSVTRAEMSAIVCRLYGESEASEAAETTFVDVEKNHWASGYIAMAQSMGVIEGYEDGTFRPENDVTYQEAVKMIISLLGYAPKAELTGGYPGGYMLIALQYGLTSEIDYTPPDPCIRRDVFTFVERALDMPMMLRISSESPDYVICNGKDGLPLVTIRGEIFGIAE